MEGSPAVFSHQLHHLDNGAEFDVQSQRNRTSAGLGTYMQGGYETLYILFYRICCYFSVAFRCVNKILKHTNEPIIQNYTDKSDQTHMDADAQSALMTTL